MLVGLIMGAIQIVCRQRAHHPGIRAQAPSRRKNGESSSEAGRFIMGPLWRSKEHGCVYPIESDILWMWHPKGALMPLAWKLYSALQVRYPKILFFHHHVVLALRWEITSCGLLPNQSVRIFSTGMPKSISSALAWMNFAQPLKNFVLSLT